MTPRSERILGRLDRLLLGELARFFVATLFGVVLLYLVIDFADRSHTFRGPQWVRNAAELYANRAAVVGHQLAPAALVIAAALLVAQLARRGELTALFALGVNPLRVCAPIAAFAALLASLLVLVQERVVWRADARAEEINVRRFGRWGDFGFYLLEQSWVKGKQGRIFHLGRPVGDGWEPVTVLELAQPFRLARRLDARRLEPTADGRWRLLDVTETQYPATLPGTSERPSGAPTTLTRDAPARDFPQLAEVRAAERIESFPDKHDDLSLRSGRPRQLRWHDLHTQAERREKLGLPAREFRTVQAERVAAPFLVPPAVLVAAGLTLAQSREGRRRALASAIALGMGLSLGLWALTVIAHAAAVGGAVAPWAAGVLPVGIAVLAAAITLWRAR